MGDYIYPMVNRSHGGLAGLFRLANDVTKDLFGNVALPLVIFFPFFFALKHAGYTTARAFAASVFVTLLSMFPLRWAGIVDDRAIMYATIALIPAVIGLFMEKRFD